MTQKINWQGKYWLPIAAVLGFLVLFLLGALRPSPTMEHDANISPLIEIYQVSKRSLDPVITGFGRAQPQQSWSAISEVSGRVIYRHPELERGRTLPAQTVVLKIDPVDYELALAQSRSSLKSAELELGRVNLNKRAYEQSRSIEQGRLAIAKKELKRKQDLKKKGLISSSELETQRNAVLSQEQTVWDLDSKLMLIPTDTEVAEANVKVAEAKLKESQRSLARTQIQLPFDARIGAVNVELGQVVNQQEKLIEAHDLAVMEITANMSLSDMRKLVGSTTGQTMLPGQNVPDIRNLNLSAKISLVVGKQNFVWQGVVDRIDDSIDADANTIGLTIKANNDMANFDPRESVPLLKDMYVQVDVTGQSRPSLVIPSRALHGNKVYVLGQDNRIKITEVNVTYNQSGFSAIDSGLQAGDVIVLSDILAPLDGMRVRRANASNNTQSGE